MKLFISLTIVLFAAAISACSQTFTVLHSFSDSDGARPESPMVLDGDTLYGTTTQGGAGGRGNLFKMKTDGTGFEVLHSSTNVDWFEPRSMILDGDTLYGTTAAGYSGGSVFKINTNGSGYTVLAAFTNMDNTPAGVVLSGGTLYGVTAYGGSGKGGTVYKVNTDGSGFEVLFNFPDSATNTAAGTWPYAGLAISGGFLYGTTMYGGNENAGTVFRMDTNGNSFETLHSFGAISNTNLDGAGPHSPLIVAGDTIYGTTTAGGESGDGVVFRINTDGSGFAVLHIFPIAPNQYGLGYGPWAGLLLIGKTLYGTAENDNGEAQGTIFRINTDGASFTRLHTFSDATGEGGLPLSGLVAGGNTLYGTAAINGPGGSGTLFKLQMPDFDPPVISSVAQTNGGIAINWSAHPGSSYQLQYTSDAAAANWNNLGEIILATNSVISVQDSVGTDSQRFYRVSMFVP